MGRKLLAEAFRAVVFMLEYLKPGVATRAATASPKPDFHHFCKLIYYD
jgi:hypothetical protein